MHTVMYSFQQLPHNPNYVFIWLDSHRFICMCTVCACTCVCARVSVCVHVCKQDHVTSLNAQSNYTGNALGLGSKWRLAEGAASGGSETIRRVNQNNANRKPLLNSQ